MGTSEGSLSYGKKQWRSIVWRMKAAVKKAVKKNGKGKHQFRFQYDPSSYALNFDDGCYDMGEKTTRFVLYQNEIKFKNNLSKSVYYAIVFVES